VTIEHTQINSVKYLDIDHSIHMAESEAAQEPGKQAQGKTSMFSIARPKDQDWQRIKPIFKKLYLDNDEKLEDIMTHLHQEYYFRASAQMYKKRIKLWGFEKNLKQHEVEHILGILAQRKAQGKNTYFLLRGRKVDMKNVYRFQRRKKLSTNRAISTYVTGDSLPCEDLQPVTPPAVEASTWSIPFQQYEDTLRAFRALFNGLVDSRYYWIESDEIVMPPSTLRDEVSDVCSSLVASKNSGINLVAVRKLALLLESIIFTDDAWTHCRLIYLLWVISASGHSSIAQSLLSQLNRLVTMNGASTRPQHQFVHHYSQLEVSLASRLAGDMILLKADQVRAYTAVPLAFRVRALEYDVYWRQREQGVGMTFSRTMDLFKRCHTILGLLSVETLTVLRTGLEDFTCIQVELSYYLDLLMDTQKLTFRDYPPTFTFDDELLSMESAAELARVYCQIGLHDTEAWIFKKILAHDMRTASCLRREYSLLVHVSCCPDLHRQEPAGVWLQRKDDIEDAWQREVEAVTPTTDVLLDSGK
jgi:hypothetical protein